MITNKLLLIKGENALSIVRKIDLKKAKATI